MVFTGVIIAMARLSKNAKHVLDAALANGHTPSSYNRLLTMGLLDKVPMRSSVLRRFLSSKNYTYSEYDVMQMLALYHTPGIPRGWVDFQFQRLGELPPDAGMRKLRRFIYKHDNIKRFAWIGQRNVQYIGPDEVQRFYLRRDFTRKIVHPNWAVAVMLQHRKNGVTIPQLGEMYKVNPQSLSKILYSRNIFEPYYLDRKSKTR